MSIEGLRRIDSMRLEIPKGFKHKGKGVLFLAKRGYRLYRHSLFFS